MAKHAAAGSGRKAAPVREVSNGTYVIHVSPVKGNYSTGVERALKNLGAAAREIQAGSSQPAKKR